MTGLIYDDDTFTVQARKILTGGHALSFEIVGDACVELLPHLVDGRLADPARLGLRPKLQPLLAVVMLASSLERTVVIEPRDDSVLVRIR